MAPRGSTCPRRPHGNQRVVFRVQAGMDEIERAAIRDEGYDPDDPGVVAALDIVRWEL